jgi:DNA-binding MarR family transcriptional regulator
MHYSEILIRIRKIIRSVNLESKRIEKEYSISIPQLLCLNFLDKKENFMASHKEIKDFLQLNASTVTGIISRLEKKGFVARLPNRKDKRVGLISITAKGSDLLENTPEPLHEQLSGKLKSLTQEELNELMDAFDTIIEFLNIESVDASPIITAGTDIPNRLN